MADGWLIVLGVPLGTFPATNTNQAATLLRQGTSFVDFAPEADDLLQYMTLARHPDQVLAWLNEKSDEPAEEQLQALVDEGVLWYFGDDRTADVAALGSIKLVPQGEARGHLSGSRDLYHIACRNGRHAAVTGILYWAWIYSDGRSLAAAADRVAEHYGQAPTVIRAYLATFLHQLLVPGAAYVDVVQ